MCRIIITQFTSTTSSKRYVLVAIGYEQPALTLVHSIFLSTTIKTSGSSSSIRTNSQGFGETKATYKTIKMSVEEEETIPFSSTAVLNNTNDDNPPYFDTTKKISIPAIFFPISFHCIISPPMILHHFHHNMNENILSQ